MLNLKSFFKKNQKLKSNIDVDRTLLSGKMVNSDINETKRIIATGSYNELLRLYDTMLLRDYRIAADINSIANDIIALDYELIGDNQQQLELIKLVLSDKQLQIIIGEMKSLISFGLGLFNLQWGLQLVNNQQYFLPKLHYVSPSLINQDDMDFYLYIEDRFSVKYKLEDNAQFLLARTAYHDDLRNYSILRQVAFVYSVKQFILGSYVQYSDLLGVPPVIVQTDNEDEKQINFMLDQVLNLRSNSAGIFNKNDIVTLFEGKASAAFFLDFIAYLDSEISHIITNGAARNSSSKTGSLAQGEVEQKKTERVIKTYAKHIANGINELITMILHFNFANIDPSLRFNFIYPDSEDKEQKAKIYQALHAMGIELSQEQIRTEFNLQVPLDENDTVKLNIGTLDSENNKNNENMHIVEANASNEDNDEIDDFVDNLSYEQQEQDLFGDIIKIINSSQDYSQALEQLKQSYPKLDETTLVKRLEQALSIARIAGDIEDEK